MVIHPMSKTVEVHSDVQLTCGANVKSSYYWKKESDSIQSEAKGLKSKVLTLVNVSPSDSGRYQCVAINKHGTFSSDFAMLIVN